MPRNFHHKQLHDPYLVTFRRDLPEGGYKSYVEGHATIDAAKARIIERGSKRYNKGEVAYIHHHGKLLFSTEGAAGFDIVRVGEKIALLTRQQ